MSWAKFTCGSAKRTYGYESHVPGASELNFTFNVSERICTLRATTKCAWLSNTSKWHFLLPMMTVQTKTL